MLSMVCKMKVGIAGAAGYTAGELLRILLNHPQAEVRYIQSESHKGHPVYKVHKDLLYSSLVFTDIDFSDIDVLFLCMGHGVSAEFLNTHLIPANVKVIDLGNDFRLSRNANGFVYGLPELSRDTIAHSRYIANPGCFATAIELGLLPLAASNLLPDEITVVESPAQREPGRNRRKIPISVTGVIICPIIRFLLTSIWKKFTKRCEKQEQRMIMIWRLCPCGDVIPGEFWSIWWCV